MSLSLYDLTVPILSRALTQQLNFLKEGEKWAKENNVSEQKVIDGKLADDMKTLPFQIQSCCNTAKLLLPRIAGGENTPVEDNEQTFDDLYKRIESTIEILKGAKRESFIDPQTKISMKMGPNDMQFTALGYVQNFVLPNFFFHHQTAYLILRHLGAPVGKLIYLGASDIQDV